VGDPGYLIDPSHVSLQRNRNQTTRL
jgi:hypothetical protein